MTDTPKPTQTSRSICVFCGSNPGRDPVHVELAKALGEALAAQGQRLVYGGGGLGLMGAVARGTHEAGGDVLGIIPEFLAEAEKTLTDVEHIFVPDMHTRKIKMFEESDAFIVLPGGIGTLEEVVEVLSWLRLTLHEKPVVFLSSNGFWDSFMKVFEEIIIAGFIPESFKADLLNAHSPETALQMIADRIANPLPRTPLNLSSNLRDVS